MASTLDTNLISFYNCNDNGTFPDDGTGSYAGTISWATFSSWGWKVGSCYDYDGTNDYVTANPWTLWSPTNYSVSLWFNADSTSNWQRLIEKNTNTSFSYILEFLSSNLSVRRAANGSIYQVTTATAGFSTGTRYHIVITFETSGNVKMYVDTSLTTWDATSTFGVDSNTYKLWIWAWATWSDNPTWYFNGKIDSIWIRDKTLTTDEVAELYNSGDWLEYPFSADTFVPKTTFIM